MKLIKPSLEILEQGPGLEGIYEVIERAGRTCYKSKRPEGQTAKDFVDRMIASKHYAMLEHGTVYLTYPINDSDVDIDGKPVAKGLSGFVWKYMENPYSKVYFHSDDLAYITTNFRVLVENGWLDDLKYLCEPTEYHERRVTVRFTTSNGIMREFTRHRVFSFAVESTRYCNYSKDRFNNELTFIIPNWASDIIEGPGYDYSPDYQNLLESTEACSAYNLSNCSPCNKLLVGLKKCEDIYLDLINNSEVKPQEAREILPLATKCDMVMTGFVSDWNHFFRLRTSIIAETGKPHPDASNLANPLMNEFINKGYINEKL